MGDGSRRARPPPPPRTVGEELTDEICVRVWKLLEAGQIDQHDVMSAVRHLAACLAIPAVGPAFHADEAHRDAALLIKSIVGVVGGDSDKVRARIHAAMDALGEMRTLDERRWLLASMLHKSYRYPPNPGTRFLSESLCRCAVKELHVERTEALERAALRAVQAWENKASGRGNTKPAKKWDALDDFARLCGVDAGSGEELRKAFRRVERRIDKGDGPPNLRSFVAHMGRKRSRNGGEKSST